MNEEAKQFQADLLKSIDQAKRGEFARVHTPDDIAGRVPGQLPPGAEVPLDEKKVSPGK